MMVISLLLLLTVLTVINGGTLTGGATAVFTYTDSVQDSDTNNFASPQQAMDWVYAQFAL